MIIRGPKTRTETAILPPPEKGWRWVYVLHAGTIAKIGVTVRLAQRLQAVRKHRRFGVEFYCAYRVADRHGERIEFIAQNSLRKWLIGNDWFLVDPARAEKAVVAAIESHLGPESPLHRFPAP